MAFPRNQREENYSSIVLKVLFSHFVKNRIRPNTHSQPADMALRRPSLLPLTKNKGAYTSRISSNRAFQHVTLLVKPSKYFLQYLS